MPLYEYECQACGNRIEEQQRMADAPLKTCPKCGKDELQRLISATAFHLKGGGWYKDLYASSKPGSENSAGSGAPASSPAPAGDSSSTAAAAAPAAAPAPAAPSTPTGGGSGGPSGGSTT